MYTETSTLVGKKVELKTNSNLKRIKVDMLRKETELHEILKSAVFQSVLKIKDAIYTIISSLHTIFYMVSLNEFTEYF